MKLDRRWVWGVLLLSCLAVAAQDKQLEIDVSETEDMGLDEEELNVLMEDEVEDVTVKDKDDSDEKDTANGKNGQPGTDENVSFQVTYKTPVPTGDVYFAETFDDGTLDRWQLSKTVTEDADDEITKYDGKWVVEQLKENKVPGDYGLVLKSRAKHHAIAAMLDKPFVFLNEPLVVQYEVNFQEGIDCGGAYIKLLSNTGNFNLEQFQDRTPYTIMFGPDKCGEDYKLHFIFRHQNPLNKDFEEKHAKRPDVDLKKFYTDRKTHLYTLVLNPDNSYEMFIDQSRVSHGSLLNDVVPPVSPAKEIDDPHDAKPEDWDERAKIPDPEAVKPDDWDEDAPAKTEDPEAIKPEGWLEDEAEFGPDPNAAKPEDWDEEMDGEWEAPQIPNPVCETAPGCGEWKRPTINNPQYKGKWKALLVDNPNYQGVWKPRKIVNPEYFEDLQPFRMAPVKALGLELWSMTSDIYFDNFIITSDMDVADRWASDSWGLKKLVASSNEPGIFAQLLIAAEERPWLWVIYILTVGLPVGLIVLFCWPKKSEDEYVYKKMDQPQPDVEEEEEEEEEDDEAEAEDAEAAADEEEKEAEGAAASATDEAEEDEEEEEKKADVGGGDNIVGDKEEEEEEEDDDKEEEAEAKTISEDEMQDKADLAKEDQKQAVRKRRVRKD